MAFELYVVDTETTGISPIQNDVIEVSIYRLSNNVQKTWMIKPINMESISEDALRVNKHKIEDLKGLTKYGQEHYQEPKKVIVEIENWLMEDMISSTERIIVAHNAPFDKGMLQELWIKCGAQDTYPFNDRFAICTMQNEFLTDYACDKTAEGYSLFALCKKYGIKNDNAHSAADDVRATVALFRKQMELYKKRMKG